MALEQRFGSGLPGGGQPLCLMMSSPLPPPPPHFSCLPASDYIIKEKTVLLQKKDSEGFGFVLRGAKGECQTGRGWEKGSVTPEAGLEMGAGKGKGPQPAHHPTPGCWSLSCGEASVTWV